jgi:hypothetical protein
MAYSTIDKPSKYFQPTLWVADDTSPRTITGFGHQPDMVWFKHRGTASLNPTICDRVRGGDKFLGTNISDAEDTKSHGEITAWNADGITVADGTSGTYPRLYFNDFDPFGSGGGNMVAWSWSASGTTGVSNTAGTITSTVSANTTSGFSVVSYTGNGTSGATFGHGLGTTPAYTIVKNRSSSGTNWMGFHKSLGNTKSLLLNSTEVPRTNVVFWNNTSPTSTLITLGNDSDVNTNGNNYIAYCFAEVKGFSKFSSFVGNGSTDGAFVYTGFKPSFVMIKSSSSGGAGYNWGVWDNKRLGYNVDNNDLRINLTNAENTDDSIDLVSNGFKMRTDSGGFGGGSGTTYIYMAFAENPFVSSKGIPCTAR